MRTLALALALIGIALGLGSCSKREPVTIAFQPLLDSTPFACGDTDGITPQDLRFFVHDVELLDAQGHGTAVQLDEDHHWQHGAVVLLDFENGTDSCDNGTQGTHTTLQGRVPAARYVGLRFKLGVPFESNHADPATAAAPLNIGQMSWGWQGGFKFFRFEGTRRDGGAFRFHLGSTGCEGSIGAIQRCARPNRAVIQVDDFEPGRDVIAFDLAALVKALPKDGVQSCMAEVGDRACGPLFAALGLDLASGEPRGRQSLFVAQRRTGSPP